MAKVSTRRSKSTEAIFTPSSLTSQSIVDRKKRATMRRTTSTSDIPTPVTYTPTTHRISKAKKGKRVHACEFPGCNKVFTRAEHRRRHELNHNPEASFPCRYEGCRKAFHRPDLLARHMERHELDAQSEGNMSRHWKQPSQSSILSDSSSAADTIPTCTGADTLPVVSSGSMSIGSIVAPGVHPDLANDYPLPWGGMEIPMDPRTTPFRHHIRESAGDSPFYSSPDTCGSPLSDVPSFHLSQPRSVSSAPTSVIFNPELVQSPLQIDDGSDWDPIESANIIPFSLEGDMLQPVGEPSLGPQPLRIVTDIPPDFPMPVPLSNLDGVEWFALRRELTSAPGVVSGNDGMEIMDTMKWQDCFECYWRHFHPLFPIVHRPTFFATKPSPLLAGAMVAIGSQYDTRHNAKEYSLALLEACLKLLSKRTPITSRSRITDIQTVFLLEFLSKFRSRRADVQLSHRFRSLYGSYMHDRHWISQNPLAVLNTLPENPTQEALTKAHKFWVEHETRRRVLQAAFIFDAQQSALFGQPRVFLQRSAVSSRIMKPSVGAADLPFPCDSSLWETWHLQDWFRMARSHRSLSLPSVAMSLGQHGERSSSRLDTFQSTLLLLYDLTSQRSQNSDAWLSPSDEQDHRPPSSPLSQTCSLFTYHAFTAARHTPLHALLTVSGESWLFNRKVPHEEDFQKAKDTLRRWASDTEDIRKAVWHAVRVLECALYNANPNPLLPDNAQLTTGQGHRAVGNRIPRSSPALSAPAIPLLRQGTSATQPGPLAMLHANWALYISALICWAYGFDPSTSRISASYPSDMSSRSQPAIAASARSYISTMISLAPTWQRLSHDRIPVTVRCNTLSLLEFIRTTRLQEGRMGGLLNEGERVLARLTETRATINAEGRGMWEFPPVSF
ncbi:hypothetical protein Plec18170_005827 [Paecilomyces lecythidis]